MLPSVCSSCTNLFKCLIIALDFLLPCNQFLWKSVIVKHASYFWFKYVFGRRILKSTYYYSYSYYYYLLLLLLLLLLLEYAAEDVLVFVSVYQLNTADKICRLYMIYRVLDLCFINLYRRSTTILINHGSLFAKNFLHVSVLGQTKANIPKWILL